ncbi:MAG: polymer-forming cytoskeletal protein [Bacteroidetes bacterium]|nr:MAG: polymer-forming cytoskeletal protein [Bacteroidota bacterium]
MWGRRLEVIKTYFYTQIKIRIMLGTKAKPKAATASRYGQPDGGTPESLTTCVVAKGTTIEGKFSAKEDVRMDGTILGEVYCENRIVIGTSGRVEGTLQTRDAVIMGTIEGEIEAHGTIHLKNTAYIKGTIKAEKLVVDEGARYIGECKIGQNPKSAAR